MELKQAGSQLAELQRTRGGQVAELTRLSEALFAAQARHAEAKDRALASEQSLAERAAETVARSSAARQGLAAGLAACRLRVLDLRRQREGLLDRGRAEKGAALSASGAFPCCAEERSLAEQATALEQQVQRSRAWGNLRREERDALQAECRHEADAEQRLQDRLATLRAVHEKADRQLAAIPDGDGDYDGAAELSDPAELAVLELVRLALPYASFTSAAEALTALHDETALS